MKFDLKVISEHLVHMPRGDKPPKGRGGRAWYCSTFNSTFINKQFTNEGEYYLQFKKKIHIIEDIPRVNAIAFPQDLLNKKSETARLLLDQAINILVQNTYGKTLDDD